MTVELFHVISYKAGLRFEDMQLMTIGMVLDYIEEFVDHNNPKKTKQRKAKQADFDAF